VEVGAGMMVKAAEAGVRSGAAAAGRLTRIYTKLVHNKTLAMTSAAISTFPFRIFFIVIQVTGRRSDRG
jgi:hypothetical protein